jgi:hypothetical protein
VVEAAPVAAPCTSTEDAVDESGMIWVPVPLVTKHGFSLRAVRATLIQLKSLGMSTTDVKAAIVKKFSELVEQADV